MSEQLIGYIILFSLAIISLFLAARKTAIISIVPGAVLLGLLVLGVQRLDSVTLPFLDSWNQLPSILINIVFASLFIGKRLISPRKIWRFAGPQVVFGQTLAWGQYVFGSLLALLVLVPIFNFSPLSGALIEISFEGGHGTAAGLQNLFSKLNFSEGADIALGLATVGLVTGIASGLLLRYLYFKRLQVKSKARKTRPSNLKLHSFIIQTQNKYLARHSIKATLLQISLIVIAILIGYIIKQSLLAIETKLFPSEEIAFFSYIPLFPLAMIGGVIVQALLSFFKLQSLVKANTIGFISNLALEMLIIAAVATISFVSITHNLWPFVLLAVTGIVWNLLAFLFIAPKIINNYWFERGIGDYGQSMGMTATGLLLIHAADPKDKSQAIELFGYKQLLFEPIVGGGLFTASSMLIIYEFGLGALLGISLAVLVFWLLAGYFFFIKNGARK